MCLYKIHMQYTILGTPRLISSAFWLVCVSILSLLAVVHMCFHLFFSGSLLLAPPAPLPLQMSRHTVDPTLMLVTQLLNMTLSVVLFIREAQETQEYQELLENQGNQENQETQYVLNEKTEIMVT